MEYLIIALVCIVLYLCVHIKTVTKNDNNSNEIDILTSKIAYIESERVDTTKVISIDYHNSLVSKYESALSIAEDSLSGMATKYRYIVSKQKSEQVRLGLIAENLAPILEGFPYDSSKIRGLFNPVDYIYFGDDEIVFVEFKTGKSSLSKKQKNIKKLVDNMAIRWETHRIDNGEYTIE